jgi:hypothetical protein
MAAGASAAALARTRTAQHKAIPTCICEKCAARPPNCESGRHVGAGADRSKIPLSPLSVEILAPLAHFFLSIHEWRISLEAIESVLRLCERRALCPRASSQKREKQMNRRLQGGASAKSRGAKLDPIVAIHEAGHALGRYITAAEMGVTEEQSITHIEIAPGTELGESSDRRYRLVSQAVTFGPMFSAELNHLIDGETDLALVSNLIRDAIARGFEISNWLEARALIAVLGPMAEAIVSQKTFYDVWDSDACESDQKGLFRDCVLAGMGLEYMDSLVRRAAEKAAGLFQRPEVVAAVKALANALPKSGVMSGKDAVAIIGFAMGRQDV